MPAKKEDLPGTLERSPAKVRRTYEKTLDSAHEQYGSEERAHRTAWAAVKHVAKKEGDRWELEDEPGPPTLRRARAAAPRASGRGRPPAGSTSRPARRPSSTSGRES